MEAQPPASFSEVLEKLHVPVTPAGAQTASGTRQSFPEAVVRKGLEQQHLSARPLDQNPRRDDARVVDHRKRVSDDVRKVCERPVIYAFGHAIVDQQARLVAERQRSLRDEPRLVSYV